MPEPVLENTIEWSDSLFGHARELWRHRELLWLLTQREIKVRYKQSVLGVAWAVLQPLSLMAVFTVFFSWFARIESDGIPYPLFSYAALLPWTFFSTSLSFAIPSLIANSHIITKIYFPREVIPLAAVMAAFLDFLIASAVFVLLIVVYRIPPSWNLLYVLPIVAIQVLFTVGVSLLLSAFTVLYRDVRHTLPLLIQIWMFVTPIFLHADFSHLFFNMIALFFFGLSLESRVGRNNFLLIFFLSGIVGSFFYMFTADNPYIPALGASGSVFGLIGALSLA
ncbi:MAG: rhomboid family intramembrane serine protease, partial [Acidobacteriota bacterium]